MTYRHYLRGELVGEHPYPIEPITDDDLPGGANWRDVEGERARTWVRGDDGELLEFTRDPVDYRVHLEPHIPVSEDEVRVFRQTTEDFLRRIIAGRRGHPRWDWLRYLGLMGRRVGAGGHLLPSGTLWEKLRGVPPRHEYVGTAGGLGVQA